MHCVVVFLFNQLKHLCSPAVCIEQQFRQTVYALAVLIGKTPESVDVTRAR